MYPMGKDTSSHHQGVLCQELWNLRAEGAMCDVILDVQGEQLRAHRVVLSACSPYLKMCCVNPTTMSQEGLVQIKVENYSFKVCLKLFEFLYTGKPVEFEGAALEEFKRLCVEWRILGMPNTDPCKSSDVTDGVPSERYSGGSPTLEECAVDWEDAASSKINENPLKTEENIPLKENDIDSSSGTLQGTSYKGAMKRGRKRKQPRDLISRKISTEADGSGVKPVESEAHREMSTDDAMLAEKCTSSTRPPLLTEDWIMSCFESDRTSTGNQQLYDADTDLEEVPMPGPDSYAEPDSDVEPNSDPDCDPDFEPATVTQPKNDGSGSEVAKPKKRGAYALSLTDKVKTKGLYKRTLRRRAVRPARELNTDVSVFKCTTCDEQFDSKEELQKHRKAAHKNKRNAWCKICKIKFGDKNQLLAHNVEHHWSEGMELPRRYVCQVEGCPYQTYNRKSFCGHKSFVHQSERSICDLCGKSLKSEASLKQHKHFVHVIALSKEYPCESCEKVFKSMCGLQRHRVNIHTDAGAREKLICPHCGLTCLNTSTMTEHLYKKHDVPPPPGKMGYKCQYCDFKTIKAREIKNHELRHFPEKQFICDICGRSYPTRRELCRHKRLHTDTCKIHKCTQCDYTTKYGRAALRSHVQVKHEDSRPWICTICSYRCKLKGNLHKHIRNVHKCEVKTNWTIPKLIEGSCSDRYLTAKFSSLKDQQEQSGAAVETGETPRSSMFSATVSAGSFQAEREKLLQNTEYDRGVIPTATSCEPVKDSTSQAINSKVENNQFDILSTLTTSHPSLGNIQNESMFSNLNI